MQHAYSPFVSDKDRLSKTIIFVNSYRKFFDIQRKDMNIPHNRVQTAGLKDVIDRITRKIFNKDKAMDMIRSVQNYIKTKNDYSDLSPQEAKALYPTDELGDEFTTTTGRDVETHWTSHAQYRRDLRDIDSGKVNEEVVKLIEKSPKYHDDQKIKLQRPGMGTAVLELDGRRPSDVEADIITVYASKL